MRRIVHMVSENALLVLILAVGIFFRFYRLYESITFLGDQGRDAIIVHRILTLEHLPAIGAPTSVGQIYLGPFYYYFIAPWLLFFNNNPAGLAYGVAFFSVLFLLVNYYIVKELFHKKIALLSTALLAFSSVLIEFSRFSWNPNLLPLFSLLTVYFFIKSVRTEKTIFYALLGIFLSLSLQLHYLALFFIPVFVFYFFQFVWKIRFDKQKIKDQLKKYIVCFLTFSFFSFPLVVFDLRHQFLNTHNFIRLFTESTASSGNILAGLLQTFIALNTYALHFDFSSIVLYSLLLVVFIQTIVIAQKKERSLQMMMLIFTAFIFLFSLYGGQKIPHYFGSVYPLYYILVAYFLYEASLNIRGKIFVLIFMAVFIFVNVKNNSFLFYNGDKQIERSQKIARVIYNNVRAQKFTVTSLPEKYSDSTYRYYLEIWNKRSLEKDSIERADELFVVCEKTCQLIGNPQWEIAFFAPRKITNTWKIDSITIYKLTR